MAEAIGIEVGKLVVEKLGFKAGKLIMSAKDINSQIERLQETKSIIEATLRDADPLESCSSVEGQMIRNLHRIEAKLEYFFDEKETRTKQKELMGGRRHAKELRLFFSSSNQLVSPFRTAAKIKEIRGELESIARDHVLVSCMASYSMSRRKQTRFLETGPFLDTNEVIGRNEDRENIITKLFHSTNDQESPSVVAIVGIGGQGKTTLAQYVYNDERVKGCFDVQLWVFATLDFSVSKVLQKIIASANTDEKTSKGEMVQLQHRMVQAIVGKKFLLVIDNVWEGPNLVENWGQVKALLRCGAKGSKVLITTRSETVARNMGTFDPYMLRDLGEDESWLLFKHFAFKQGQESSAEAIGKEIVKMIPRVPLVIKVIGCHLAEKGTIKQWQAFKNELASNSSSSVRDKIMQTLKISYDQLDKKLKLCVAYCSLLPKGAEFNVDKMVRIWSALGYVESESGNLEDVGEKYVIQLGRCGFFQEVRKDKYGHLVWFKMHDVMHDLVLSIDKSLYQVVDSRTSEIAEGVSHVSFCRASHSKWDVSSSVLNIKQQLQSILIVEQLSCYKYFKVLFHCGYDKLLSRFECLKVLDLHDLGIEKVPKFVKTLVHLRYLDLSDNPMHKLPTSITQLVNLLSLDMSWCENLQELPRDMRKLVKLRHLRLVGCFSLSHMPKGLGNLKYLQTLDRFVVGVNRGESSRPKGSVAGGLIELSDLNNLKGKLEIIVDRESKYIAEESKTAHLERKEQLTKLIINFKKRGKEDYRVLEALQPHGANLRSLIIMNYGGEKLPSWMMNNQLPDCDIKLYGSRSCVFSKWFGKYDNCKGKQVLRITINEQNHHLAGELIPEFSKLKEQLTMSTFELASKEHWSGGLNISGLCIKDKLAAYPSPSGRQHILLKSCFPNLQLLVISSIFELEVLPDVLQELSSLKHLYLENCSKLKAIPDWIGTLTSLEDLLIDNCQQMEELPDSIANLNSLETLSIEDCPKLEESPHLISNLSRLFSLKRSGCSKALVEGRRKTTGPGEDLPHIPHIMLVKVFF